MSTPPPRSDLKSPETDKVGKIFRLHPQTVAVESTRLPDLVVFSHLRWDFVFQRPQHLLTRFAREQRVFYIEEPLIDENAHLPHLEVKERPASNLRVVRPLFPPNFPEARMVEAQKELISGLFEEYDIETYVTWYYTPMALPFSAHLQPSATVYDCMDELSLFKGAHANLVRFERDLLARADVVFTGGQSLYEHKCKLHPNIFPFPSSIDGAHFKKARRLAKSGKHSAEMAALPAGPRLGFAGVIDERMDTALLEEMAALRPDWQFVLIGPVVKIDPQSLPRRPNLHYLGGRDYQDLPRYMASWDAALLPFALNDSTRFISPTKTPEYLAAGLPVISTPIRDVVRPYGEKHFVHIAESARDFVRAGEEILRQTARQRAQWLTKVDAFLSQNSWDQTWKQMTQKIQSVLKPLVENESAALAADTHPRGKAGGKNEIRQSL